MKKLVLIIPILLLACSMYKAGEKKDIASEKNFDLPFETVWSRVVSYTTKNGMNVKVIDKSSGLITFEKAYDPYFTQSYLDCGTFTAGAAAGTSPLTLNFSIQKASDKNTSLRINLFQDALLGNGAYASKVGTCYSKGIFERVIFCEIAGTPCPEIVPTPTPKPTAKQY